MISPNLCIIQSRFLAIYTVICDEKKLPINLKLSILLTRQKPSGFLVATNRGFMFVLQYLCLLRYFQVFFCGCIAYNSLISLHKCQFNVCRPAAQHVTGRTAKHGSTRQNIIILVSYKYTQQMPHSVLIQAGMVLILKRLL